MKARNRRKNHQTYKLRISISGHRKTAAHIFTSIVQIEKKGMKKQMKN